MLLDNKTNFVQENPMKSYEIRVIFFNLDSIFSEKYATIDPSNLNIHF